MVPANLAAGATGNVAVALTTTTAISTNGKGKGDFASYLTGYDVAKNTTVVGLKYSF